MPRDPPWLQVTLEKWYKELQMLISSKRTLYLAPCVWWDVTQTLREPLAITGTRTCIDETRRHYWQPCDIDLKSLKPQTCSYHVESVLNDVSKQTGHLSLVSHKSDEFDSSEFINVRVADYRCRSAQVVIDLLPLTVWRCINSILSPFPGEPELAGVYWSER